MNIILEQQEIIERLVEHNRHLIDMLGQYKSVEDEEERLASIIREGEWFGLDN